MGSGRVRVAAAGERGSRAGAGRGVAIGADECINRAGIPASAGRDWMRPVASRACSPKAHDGPHGERCARETADVCAPSRSDAVRRSRRYFFFTGSGITTWQASRHVAEGPRCQTCTYQAESGAADGPVTNEPYV